MGKTTTRLAVSLIAGLLFSAIGASAANAAFCAKGTVHDYAKPLKRLPKIRHGPLNEHLPFAPERVFFNHSRGGPLFVGGGTVGYSLSYSPYSPGNDLSPPLNWIVEARYMRVGRRGRPVRVLGHILRKVERLRSDGAEPPGRLDFLFKAGKPALYLLEIVFSDLSGQRLGRYGEYLRVLRPKLNAKLTLNRKTFKPGERVTAKLNNYGTTTLAFGLRRSIEFFDGASWRTAPNSAQGLVPLILLGTGPGAWAECWDFTIPPRGPRGKYRFVVRATPRSRARHRRAGSFELHSKFWVVDPS